MKVAHTIETTIPPAIPLFITRPGPACLADAVNQPLPKMLLSELWHEGGLSVLFGNNHAGKSLLAVQIAESICSGNPVNGFTTEVAAQKVLYFDFDTSDRQFASRYSPYKFNENFLRVTIHPGHSELRKFGEQLFTGIEAAVKEHGAKVIIIDSLSTLKYFVNDVFFLTHLLQLKNRFKLSVLLLAGAKRINPGKPLTLGHAAANKMLAGIADSVVAMGFSKREENGRYLIQLKGKEMGRVYDESRVIIGRNTVTPVTGLPGFELTGYSTEQEQLVTPRAVDPTDAWIVELRRNAPHASLGEIAKWSGTNKMKVKRVLDRYPFDAGESRGMGVTPNLKTGATSFSNPRFQPGSALTNTATLDSRLRGNDGLLHTGERDKSSPSPLLLRTNLVQGGIPNTERVMESAPDVILSLPNVCAGDVEVIDHPADPGVELSFSQRLKKQIAQKNRGRLKGK